MRKFSFRKLIISHFFSLKGEIYIYHKYIFDVVNYNRFKLWKVNSF